MASIVLVLMNADRKQGTNKQMLKLSLDENNHVNERRTNVNEQHSTTEIFFTILQPR